MMRKNFTGVTLSWLMLVMDKEEGMVWVDGKRWMPWFSTGFLFD
jgi:hypothetical protein